MTDMGTKYSREEMVDKCTKYLLSIKGNQIRNSIMNSIKRYKPNFFSQSNTMLNSFDIGIKTYEEYVTEFIYCIFICFNVYHQNGDYMSNLLNELFDSEFINQSKDFRFAFYDYITDCT